MKHFLTYIIFFIISLGLMSSGMAQQQPAQQLQLQKPDVPSISVQHVKGPIYQLKGGVGANSGFYR